MINVVCFLWGTEYTAAHVNALRRMVARNYSSAHRFVCVTNDTDGLDDEVEVVPDREDFADVPSPHGGKNPTCYRRLRLFEEDAADTFGDRIVALDLDAVVVADLRPLWALDTSFIGWADPMNKGQYNGSMFLLRAGAHPSIWSSFDPATSPAETMRQGFRGSDQGWISRKLWASWPKWTTANGVLSYKANVAKLPGKCLPPGARIVFFHGQPKPWSPEVRNVPWVQTHYQ